VLFVATSLTVALAGGWFWGRDGAEGSAQADAPLGALLAILADGWVYAFWVLLILGAHEMGHYLACRYYGIPATLPFFIPGLPPIGTFGAVIRIRAPIPDRRALFDVAAAGPIAGFVVALPVLVAGLLTGEPFVDPEPASEGVIYYLGSPLFVLLVEGWLRPGETTMAVNSLFGAGWVGMLVTSLNLFPVGQLDGGHAIYAFSRRFHRAAARATLLAMAVLVLYQLLVQREVPAYVLWFVILLWMRDRHPRLIDETERLGPGRAVVGVLLAVIFFLSFMPVLITVG